MALLERRVQGVECGAANSAASALSSSTYIEWPPQHGLLNISMKGWTSWDLRKVQGLTADQTVELLAKIRTLLPKKLAEKIPIQDFS